MDQLSTGDGALTLALIGSAPPPLKECTSYSSIHKHFRLKHYPRDGIDCYHVHDHTELDALPDDTDFILNISPGARKRVLEKPDRYTPHAQPVVFQTHRVNNPPKGILTLQLIPRAHGNAAPDGWGDGPTKADGSGRHWYLYPYAPRPEVRDRTERGVVFIDNQRDKHWDRNDTALFHDVLGELRESYDLEIWQESVTRSDVPAWVNDASAGHVKTYDDGGPPRAVRPWVEFKAVVNRAMLFLPARPGSYGADKFNTIASGGRVLIRESYEKRAVVNEFGFYTFGNRGELRSSLVSALDKYDSDPDGFKRHANSVWSAERFADETVGLLQSLA